MGTKAWNADCFPKHKEYLPLVDFYTNSVYRVIMLY